MPLPDPMVVYAVSMTALFLLGYFFRWDDLEIGERIYVIGIGLIVAASTLFVPFNIPTTGQIVFGPSWAPPRYDVPDPRTAEIITPALVERLRQESPVPLAKDFYRHSVTEQRTASRSYVGLWWALIDVLGMAGWFVVPAWLEVRFNPPRK